MDVDVGATCGSPDLSNAYVVGGSRPAPTGMKNCAISD